MRINKIVSQSLQVIILVVGFLPLFFFDLCDIDYSQGRLNRDNLLIDSIKRDSLVKTDSVDLEVLFKKKTTVFNIDSFSKFYNRNKISDSFIDSFLCQDSIKRMASYGNHSALISRINSIYFYLINTVYLDWETTGPLEILAYLLIDLMIILSWIGVVLILVNSPRKFKYFRIMSLLCLLFCIITILTGIPFPGFLLLSILFLVSVIINHKIVKEQYVYKEE